jgi:hypothetical protein
VKSKSGRGASLIVILAIFLLSASPAGASICQGHNTENPHLGKVGVCVHEDGSASAVWSTWDPDDGSTSRVYVLVGLDYTGVCVENGTTECTPDVIETR